MPGAAIGPGHCVIASSTVKTPVARVVRAVSFDGTVMAAPWQGACARPPIRPTLRAMRNPPLTLVCTLVLALLLTVSAAPARVGPAHCSIGMTSADAGASGPGGATGAGGSEGISDTVAEGGHWPRSCLMPGCIAVLTGEAAPARLSGAADAAFAAGPTPVAPPGRGERLDRPPDM